ncbi:MAG: hypothetical protein P1P84_16945 [Deferrisomatales bacterium]|nr:hypothetical protein [Deferrisomatales bacterium]
MDVSSLVSGAANAARLQRLGGLAQAPDAAGAQVALLDQVLELERQFASQLLQSMGVGGNLDLFA